MDFLASLLGGGGGGFMGGLFSGTDVGKQVGGFFGDIFAPLNDMFSSFFLSIGSMFGITSKSMSATRETVMHGIDTCADKIKRITDSADITSSELTASVIDALKKTTSNCFGTFGMAKDGIETVQEMVKLQNKLAMQFAGEAISRNPKLSVDKAKGVGIQLASAITGLATEQANFDPASADAALYCRRIVANAPTAGLLGQLLAGNNAMQKNPDAAKITLPTLTFATLTTPSLVADKGNAAKATDPEVETPKTPATQKPEAKRGK